MLVAGCAKDSGVATGHVPETGTLDFKLYVGESVRSELDTQTLGISFEEGDAVEINGAVYDVSFDDNGNPELLDVAVASDNIYRAMFAGDNSFFATSDKNYKFPNLQCYREGSFDKQAMAMLAYLENTGGSQQLSLTFNCLMGVMRLPVTGSAEIRSIKVSNKAFDGDDASTYLSGRMVYDDNEGGYATVATSSTLRLTHQMSTALVPDIVVLCNDGEGNGVKLSADATDFYIVMPAREYTGGLTVTITDNSHRSMTVSTSGTTVINEGVVTPMQPIAYSPDSDLVFAEHFDACVYGSDIVSYRNGAKSWRGYLPNRDGSGQAGVFANKSNTGLEPNMYYGSNKNATDSNGSSVPESMPGSDIYANWYNAMSPATGMDGAKSAGVLTMSESFIRSRGLWDWSLSRIIEYQGYVAVGNAASTRAAFSTTATGSPQGDCFTPYMSNLEGTKRVELSFKVAAGLCNAYQNFSLYCLGAGTIVSCTCDDVDDGSISIDSENNIANIPTMSLPVSWTTVRVTIDNATADTYFRFYTPDGKNGSSTVKTATFFLDDVVVREAV